MLLLCTPLAFLHSSQRSHRQIFIFTKSFCCWLPFTLAPPTSLPSDHCLFAHFWNTDSSLDSTDRCTVSPFNLLCLPLPSCFLLFFVVQSALELIAPAQNPCHTWPGMLKRKSCALRRPPRRKRLFRDKQNQQGVVPDTAPRQREQGERKTAVLRDYVTQMKSDVADTRWSCRNLPLDNPAAAALCQFTTE